MRPGSERRERVLDVRLRVLHRVLRRRLRRDRAVDRRRVGRRASLPGFTHFSSLLRVRSRRPREMTIPEHMDARDAHARWTRDAAPFAGMALLGLLAAGSPATTWSQPEWIAS